MTPLLISIILLYLMGILQSMRYWITRDRMVRMQLNRTDKLHIRFFFYLVISIGWLPYWGYHILIVIKNRLVS